jgi:hypothetical protein
MKAKLLLTMFLGTMIILPWGAMAQDKAPMKHQQMDHFVTLGMLDQSLAGSEGSAIDVFNNPKHKVDYLMVNLPRYDEFFKEAAMITGATREVRFVLGQLRDKKIRPAEAKPVIDFAQKILPRMNDRIPGLVDQAKSMKPDQDFTDAQQKSHAERATKALTRSVEYLNAAKDEIPKLMEEINRLEAKKGNK